MSTTTNTGGAKEFHYTKEDYEKIQSKDTEHTKAFKKELRKHYQKPKISSVEFKNPEPNTWRWYLKWISLGIIVASIIMYVGQY